MRRARCTWPSAVRWDMHQPFGDLAVGEPSATSRAISDSRRVSRAAGPAPPPPGPRPRRARGPGPPPPRPRSSAPPPRTSPAELRPPPARRGSARRTRRGRPEGAEQAAADGVQRGADGAQQRARRSSCRPSARRGPGEDLQAHRHPESVPERLLEPEDLPRVGPDRGRCAPRARPPGPGSSAPSPAHHCSPARPLSVDALLGVRHGAVGLPERRRARGELDERERDAEGVLAAPVQRQRLLEQSPGRGPAPPRTAQPSASPCSACARQVRARRQCGLVETRCRSSPPSSTSPWSTASRPATTSSGARPGRRPARSAVEEPPGPVPPLREAAGHHPVVLQGRRQRRAVLGRPAVRGAGSSAARRSSCSALSRRTSRRPRRRTSPAPPAAPGRGSARGAAAEALQPARSRRAWRSPYSLIDSSWR